MSKIFFFGRMSNIFFLGRMSNIFFFIWMISFSSFGSDKSICGETDDREFSEDKKIGRVNDGTTSVCTVTMIGKKCALSAGHCHRILREVSFNVPKSRNGELSRASKENRYPVDRYETFYSDNGPGNDYAVVELLANEVTGKLPGDVQGFYEVSYERAKVGDEIFVTGFGKDSRPSRNHSQQTHEASILSGTQSTIQHNVDTRFGNSGSVIIDKITKKIIGIHTHGACYAGGGSNYGTLISGHTRLKQGIRNCLAREQ